MDVCLWRTNSEHVRLPFVDADTVTIRRAEAKRRVICIAAAIIVARHIKDPNELLDYRPSRRTDALIANAIRIASRILERIENAFV